MPPRKILTGVFVCVDCEYVLADLEEQHFCSKFSFTLRESASETRDTNLCFLLCLRNQTAVLSVENPALSTSEESETEQIQHRDNVDDVSCDCEDVVRQELVPLDQTV